MKIIKENIYNFHKIGDVKSSLGIGRRHLIEEWLEGEMGKTNYKIEEDWSINFDGAVNLDSRGIEEIPEYIQFGKIKKGFFSISHNSLRSLRGCPISVKGSFYCNDNLLETLEFSPSYVGLDFFIVNNPIKDLRGISKFIGGDFVFGENRKVFTERDLKGTKLIGNVIHKDY